MKTQTSILLAAAFIAVAAVSVRSQQTWQDKARELNSRTVQVAQPASAVILRLYEVAHADDYGEYTPTGQAVEYATVSAGVTGISNDMNAAQAIAIAASDGRKCILSQYGFLVFASQ